MKKFLIISFIIVVVAGLGFFVWNLVFPASSAPVVDKISDVLPFGSGEDLNIPPQVGGGGTGDAGLFDITAGRPTTKLFRITESAVAGVVAFEPNSSTTIVRFADRATGHIYDLDLTTFKKTKVTNTTLPKIYEAHFSSDGSAVLYRSLVNGSDTQDNRVLSLTPPTSTSTSLYTINTAILRSDMDEVATDGASLFYTLEESSSIAIRGFGGEERTILSLGFNDWRLAPYGSSLVAYTKASSRAEGYAYSLNTSNGALSKILGPLNGLTVNPHSQGDYLAYSYVDQGKTRTIARDIANDTSIEILPATLVEKCVWGTQEEWLFICGIPTTALEVGEPDKWYQGSSHYSDNIWAFDTRVDIAEILIKPKDIVGLEIDIYKPFLSPSQSYLFFINRNDLSLWALDLD